MLAYTLDDPRDQTKVQKCLRTVLASKQYGYESKLAALIAEACIQILPKNNLTFHVDSIRVTKILGGGVMDTKLVKGFVLPRDSEGTCGAFFRL
jgi:T-complex protein 1 subunit theta